MKNVGFTFYTNDHNLYFDKLDINSFDILLNKKTWGLTYHIFSHNMISIFKLLLLLLLTDDQLDLEPVLIGSNIS